MRGVLTYGITLVGIALLAVGCSKDEMHDNHTSVPPINKRPNKTITIRRQKSVRPIASPRPLSAEYEELSAEYEELSAEYDTLSHKPGIEQ